jgi:hypothetical protein
MKQIIFLSKNIHLKQRFYFVQFLVIPNTLFIPHHDPTWHCCWLCVCVARFEYAFVIQILLMFNAFVVCYMWLIFKKNRVLM